MRFADKHELIRQIEDEHDALVALIRSVPAERLKESGVWGDHWTVLDLLSHLTEWEQMMLGWYRDGLAGRRPQIPAPGYKYNETPALNRAIQQKYARYSRDRVFARFEQSYAEVLALTRSLTEAQLLQPGAFAWTGANPLTTYLAANTCCHYRFAIRVLKRRARSTEPLPSCSSSDCVPRM